MSQRFAPDGAQPTRPIHDLGRRLRSATHDFHGQGAIYQLGILVLSIGALVAMSVQALTDLHPETLRLLGKFDDLVCIVFFADFLASLRAAPNRLRYMATWGWLDLISSIPQVRVLRWGRAARVIRVLRLLRAVRSSRMLGQWLTQRRIQGAAWASVFIGFVVLFVASLSVLQLERDVPGANIQNADDALWWAFVTVTTVGYGDRFPVTPEGRFLAGILMLTGVGTFGTLTAVFASRFVGAEHRDLAREIEALRLELVELRRTLVPTVAHERRTADPTESEPSPLPGSEESESPSSS